MKKNIAFVILFSLLLCLGFWQIHRLDYKNYLIKNIEVNSKLPPVKINLSDFSSNIYKNISIKGSLNNLNTIFYYRLKNNIPGYEVITPLLLADNSVLLVSRGWLKDKVDMSGNGNVQVQGYLIEKYRSSIGSPKNNIKDNIWFDLNAAELELAIASEKILPFILLLKSPEKFAVGDQDIGFDIHNLPNNHLGYAMTWFALAVVLLVIFVIDYRNRGKK
ncbi:MAG: SURF1 family protein [Alphaproteobacteria bacterium]|nr:SURF1 family protein [Alphaproteobacteria bacterium]